MLACSAQSLGNTRLERVQKFTPTLSVRGPGTLAVWPAAGLPVAVAGSGAAAAGGDGEVMVSTTGAAATQRTGDCCSGA